jgi:hypothetical protein
MCLVVIQDCLSLLILGVNLSILSVCLVASHIMLNGSVYIIDNMMTICMEHFHNATPSASVNN